MAISDDNKQKMARANEYLQKAVVRCAAANYTGNVTLSVSMLGGSVQTVRASWDEQVVERAKK